MLLLTVLLFWQDHFMHPPTYIGEGGNMQSGCDVCLSFCLSVSDNKLGAYGNFGLTDGVGTTDVFFLKHRQGALPSNL